MKLPIIRARDENGNVVDIPGIIGPPGKTPQKGVDYWTPEDKAEMIEETAAALPAPDVSTPINTHNTSEEAHADIREALRLLEKHSHTPEAIGAAPAEHGHDYVSESRVNELLAGAGGEFQVIKYRGTGTYRKESPTSLTFSFAPDLVIYVGLATTSSYTGPTSPVNRCVMMTELSTSYPSNHNCYTQAVNFARKSADGKTLEFFSTNSAADQANFQDQYYWFVGMKF